MLNLLRRSRHIKTSPTTRIRKLLRDKANVTVFLTDSTAIEGRMHSYVRNWLGNLTEITVVNDKKRTVTTANWQNVNTITEYGKHD